MADILSKYKIIEQIYTDRSTTVYRAIRSFDQVKVIIKTLTENTPELEEIERLNFEFEITKNLNFEGIAKVYCVENIENKVALVKEDDGELSLREFIYTQEISNINFLKIAIQLSNIIGNIHLNKVIHKDINPSNILINPQTFLIKLTDFNVAVNFHDSIFRADKYSQIEGTLDYISPEQTGRMNCIIDYRTDFYSLGVTLYEIITKKLPFQASDPVEKIYSHLTQIPVSPSQINSNIPEAISLIILKLLEKQSENRYYNAFGIKADLESCLNQLQEKHKITDFIPGNLDQSSKFIIPQKLYGRSNETNTLLAAFERVSLGKTEVLLVRGQPGTGKTVFVNSIHQASLQKKGYFAHGKFEKNQHGSPYFALVNAIKMLIKEILTNSSTEIKKWSDTLIVSLGLNAQLMIDLVPEIELIIGPQNPVSILGLKESQLRFNQTLKTFIYTFTQKGHPLVLFLDDLQWADSNSLDLIEDLINDIDTQYLFFIGTYRDNETELSNLLLQEIKNIRNSPCNFSEITLDALEVTDVINLVSETLQCNINTSKSLANLIFYKTAGNPFFVNQFLKSLYNDGLIQYDFNTNNWKYDINQIQSKSLVDESIADLLFRNFKNLPESTQKDLMLASCIGNKFTLNQLTIINQSSYLETVAHLWPAIQAGFIIPQQELIDSDNISYKSSSDSSFSDVQDIAYSFLHNRLQQAVYFLIPSEQRKRTHLQIGEFFLRQTPEDKISEILFILVNQLNYGRELILDPIFKMRLAQLNFLAGKKSKLSVAYEVSQQYLSIAIDLLPENSWENYYELTIKLYLELLEIEYLNCNIKNTEKYSSIIESKAKDLLDIVKIYKLKIIFHFTQNQPEIALKNAHFILKKIGISLPKNPNKKDIFIQLIKIKFFEKILLRANLLDLPSMDQSSKLAAMQIMMSIIPSTFVASPNLFPILIFKMVESSIKYGNSSMSSFVYGCYASIHHSILGNVSAGNHYDQIALKLLAAAGNTEDKAKVNVIFNAFNRHWKDHIKESIADFPNGIQYGLDSGDIESAGHCAAFYCSYLFLSGEKLNSVANKHDIYIRFLNKHKQNFDCIHVNIWNQVVLNLIESSNDPCNLIGESFNELDNLNYLISSKNNILISAFYLAKIFLNFLFKKNSNAIQYCIEAQKYIENIPGALYVSFYSFYHGLSVINSYSSSTDTQKGYLLRDINKIRKNLKKWSKNSPENYEHKYDLLEAEYAKLFQKDKVAIDLYDQAIRGAQNNNYFQDEALANELAGEFYLSRGKDKIANIYLTDAYYAYFRWGALAKLKDLESRYPYIFLNNTFKSTSDFEQKKYSSSHKNALNLDFLTIYKSSQVISEEIVLTKLVDKLVQVLMQHTGAQSASLILSREESLVLEATRSSDNQTTKFIQSNLITENDLIPLSIINYVARTHEILLLNDSVNNSIFCADKYIKNKQPKSVLCMPIVNQGKLVSLIYLENNLLYGAFRDDHLEVLTLLCSQAAISIENAKLYKDLQESKAREQEERELNELKSRFISIASHEFRTPLTTILGTSELIKYYSQNWTKEKTQTYLDRICDNVKNMVSLLDEVLFLSKGEAGKIDFQAEPTELIEFCNRIVNESQLGAKSGQTINFSFPERLYSVDVDQRLLQHILRNLLSNAVKYSFPNSIVLFDLKFVDNEIVFKVQDNGIGIPEEDQRKLFGSFHRANNVGSIPGSGLGLSIVKQCVDLHGGSIAVVSTVGIGTIFNVTIPLNNKFCVS